MNELEQSIIDVAERMAHLHKENIHLKQLVLKLEARNEQLNADADPEALQICYWMGYYAGRDKYKAHNDELVAAYKRVQAERDKAEEQNEELMAAMEKVRVRIDEQNTRLMQVRDTMLKRLAPHSDGS